MHAVQDFAALILMDKGNDYLPALAISASAGVNVREMYLEMRVQPQWRHRTLVVLDPDRAAAAFDTDMLLRLLLNANTRALSGGDVDQERAALEGGAAAAAEEAAALGSAVADVLRRGLVPEHEFTSLGVKEEVWAAWRAKLPPAVQVEALVAAATEPRVAAARDALAAARSADGGSADEMGGSNGGDPRGAAQSGGLPRNEAGDALGSDVMEQGAKEMCAALAKVKVRAHVAFHPPAIESCCLQRAYCLVNAGNSVGTPHCTASPSPLSMD